LVLYIWLKPHSLNLLTINIREVNNELEIETHKTHGILNTIINKEKGVGTMPPVDSVVETFIGTYDNILSRKTPVIYTIGYEGRTLEDFIHILKEHHINVVIDVRELPLSRKKGFSKTALSQALEENDIDYIHMKSLGTPKELRDKFKSKKITFKEFALEYEKYLNTQTEALAKLLQCALMNTCVLMCYERDWRVCHRRIIAEQMKMAKFEVVHI
jgi:uncharacterized protein YeaO (DUF488 family)